jgi:hypothetical protein
MNKMIFALLCLTSAAFAEDGFVDYVDGIVDLKINGIVGEALVGIVFRRGQASLPVLIRQQLLV